MVWKACFKNQASPLLLEFDNGCGHSDNAPLATLSRWWRTVEDQIIFYGTLWTASLHMLKPSGCILPVALNITRPILVTSLTARTSTVETGEQN